jgi:hypothetical protein
MCQDEGHRGLDWAENAAGKKLCGMCHNKATGEWRCISRSFPASDLRCPAINGECRSFFQKTQLTRPPQPKKKGLPVPPGVKLLYFGRPPGGVVTVAYSIAKKIPLVEIAFSFCSPKDRWCKTTGRDMAVERLRNFYLTVPYLYSPKRTVHEAVRAAMNHDWQTLFWAANFTQPDLRPFQRSVPSWTKGLAERMGTRRISGVKLYRFPWEAEAVAGYFTNKALADTAQQIIAHMMADIAKLRK